MTSQFRLRLRYSVEAVSVAAVMLACSQEAPNRELPPTDIAPSSLQTDTCSVAADAPDFRTALCTGQVIEMILAIDKALKMEDQDVSYSMLRLLERVWQRDQTLGNNLPWVRLGSDEMRLVLAEQLAQPIRWGRSDVSLDELRELAIRQASDSRGDRTAAIRLLGLADVRGQTHFLRNVIETSSSASERYAAIQALGMTCDVEANALLRKLTTLPSLSVAESNAVQESQRRRSTWVADMCAQTEPAP